MGHLPLVRPLRLGLAAVEALYTFDAQDMNNSTTLAAFLMFLVAASTPAAPLRLHPDNPHYFLYHGKPMVIIT
jgi:hypothetical protein